MTDGNENTGAASTLNVTAGYAPPEGHVSYMTVAGKCYRVRVWAGQREVLHNGKWITHSQFVDELMDAKDYDSVCELALYGRSLIHSHIVEARHPA